MKGCLAYITPDTWKTLSNFKKLRKLMFENFKLISITESLYDIFESATVDTTITILQKDTPHKEYKMVLKDLTNYQTKGLELDSDFVLNFRKTNSIIKKVDNNNTTLNDITEIWQGLIAYAGKDQPRIWTSDKKETEFHRKLLYGKDISKYGINWGGEYLKYGNWLHRPRPAYIFDDEKILVQRIRNPQLKIRLVCAYDDKKYINGTGLSNILLQKEYRDKYSLKFILAILNSSLINYWFSYYFVDVNIKPEQLRKIPIPTISKEAQTEIISIIDKIIELKENNKETIDLEAKLDSKVYELYGLTKEEIKIIEEA